MRGVRAVIRKRLPWDIYNRCVTFLYGTIDEINAVLRRDCPGGFEPLRPSCLGHYKVYLHDGHEADYVCIVRTGSRDSQFAVLAHETLHLAGHALRLAGIPFEEITEEAYTYYQQWLIRECLRIMPTRRQP